LLRIKSSSSCRFFSRSSLAKFPRCLFSNCLFLTLEVIDLFCSVSGCLGECCGLVKPCCNKAEAVKPTLLKDSVEKEIGRLLFQVRSLGVASTGCGCRSPNAIGKAQFHEVCPCGVTAGAKARGDLGDHLRSLPRHINIQPKHKPWQNYLLSTLLEYCSYPKPIAGKIVWGLFRAKFEARDGEDEKQRRRTISIHDYSCYIGYLQGEIMTGLKILNERKIAGSNGLFLD
jgi:hypothetical protein